ncbi:hypothetical protein BIFPSEUDO_03211 [Bifidobacterium pseudocatenulatum DSM 20438 = JCM 1200 = LMG 10505]|uniref:Uncharacterized protein n=1 Tax=Bifidobacterium pseudocatenulatum DSM 20438 = JCM 1200 = LMG 10505 TaxID=547043 RepID=C0BRE6_BIFPS|nr:hypothetical protein BIFPSEUDO_03211 [Bifidobacterium pseudocatenulatum DSM 20438 = JCM 1200 = LMG 10505]
MVRSYFLLSFLNANSDSRIVRGTSRVGMPYLCCAAVCSARVGEAP